MYEAVCLHEHGPHDPMIKDRCDGSKGQKCGSRMEAVVGGQDDSTRIQHHTTPQREDDELDDDEGSNLITIRQHVYLRQDI